ncbi:scavenger receptor cysteine-rich domain-containing protein DMBT1-like isoform X24 [Paramisgurnus dabryanus]|uniref:scavenger receptor cysteine-rich domain-containing protein DMBT1-like isoform X24 n=1 Tax=Paramisgurnus dabryanus TaxID=90735 RepID=UPI0031F3E910
MDPLTVLLCVLLTTTGFQGFSKATTIRTLTTDSYDTTLDPSADSKSCRNYCGYSYTTCSCDDNCQYNRNCCLDYKNYCVKTTDWPVFVTTKAADTTTSSDGSSCRDSCGSFVGTCACYSACQDLGNCCPDFKTYCSLTTYKPDPTVWEDEFFSCVYNCGIDFGICSCESSCQYYGNCCFDFKWNCPVPTTTSTTPMTSTSTELSTTTSTTMTTEHIYVDYFCAYNCDIDFGPCSCKSSCQYHGNCCPDYEWSCPGSTITMTTGSTELSTTSTTMTTASKELSTTTSTTMTTGSIELSTTTSTTMTTEHIYVDYFCAFSCDIDFGPCSCKSSCQYHGNCCPDYELYCPVSTTTKTTGSTELSTTTSTTMTTGSTEQSTTTSTTMKTGSTEHIYGDHFCAKSCDIDFGPCSCKSSCQYHGNCCADYELYCPAPTTSWPPITDNHPACGALLYGSGLFSSPNYPHYYYDNAHCVWYLSAQPGQRLFLSFADVQLDRCCDCDYISVHDGSSIGHQQLGRICFNDTTHQTFHSSSRYLTVVFRSDHSGVSHGFKAQFTSSLTADQGRVDCSSDNMVIVIRASYLNSLGFNGNYLYVDDHRCRPTINSTEVVFRFSLNTCGTGKEMMNGYVAYTNNVRASQSKSGEITLQPQFLLHVGCRMEPDTVVQILYKAKEDINANITGAGRFNASIAFFTSSSFNQQIFHSPYEVNLNQYMYVQVWLNRPDTSLDLFLETCVASPDPNDFKTRSYDLLRNGCPRDSTYYSYINGQQYYARFRFQAFKFLRTHANVYLQCKVIICPDNDYNSRCRQGCRLRRKRSLESNHHTNTVILGPITLKGERPGVKKSEKRKK